MLHLCKKCNICNLGYKEERVPSLGEGKVLVLDDFNGVSADYAEPIALSEQLIGSIPHTYTTTIRCNIAIVDEQLREKALARCAVWTNLLAQDRRLVITTINGLKQIGIGEEHQTGDVFKDERYGLVVVVPPLTDISASEVPIYKQKVRRAIREANLTNEK